MSSNIAKPAEAVSNHELSQGTEQQISSAPQSSHLVVVVEDENALREVVCLGLSRFCMSVVGVSTARDAQQVLTENTAKPLILDTDLVLQGEGGWSLARWARERLPRAVTCHTDLWMDRRVDRSTWSGRKYCVLAEAFLNYGIVELPAASDGHCNRRDSGRGGLLIAETTQANGSCDPGEEHAER